ncbi:hypothetical protein FSP39_003445 [Pinctada imbricata]|uniref:Hexosyltransferase n=1 Tax=Pinctada imbricata TaxID=66713 RepID=A0AA88YIB6_PINIB|nr:hypothetical protein FSP39_003445 [Pinctada imbricata]
MSYINSRQWCKGLRNMYPLNVKLDEKHVRRILLNGKQSPRPGQLRQYKHNPSHICDKSSLKVLFIVKSAPGNFRLREAVRNSWGSEAINEGNKIVFSLGLPKDKKVQSAIDQEMNDRKDILQSTFMDSYFNLTQKSIHGIQWIAAFCPKAEFVVMVDDDVIINFHRLMSFFNNLSPTEARELLTGYVVNFPSGPIRWASKWAISRDVYPFPCYPPYVSGPIILTSGDVVQKFDAAIPFVKHFLFEDVYLGLVSMKLGITLSTANNDLFDSDGIFLHKFSCMISSHQRGISGENYEKYHKQYLESPCKD